MISNKTFKNLQSRLRQKNTKPEQRIFVDMDGTLAEFKKETPFEDLYKQNYFLTLKPLLKVVTAINIIINTQPDMKVIPLSSVLTESPYAENEKRHWLNKHLPQSEKPIFVPFGNIKSNSIPNSREDDILIDDFTRNLQEWHGTGIKLVNNINDTHKTWTGMRVYYNDPSQKIAEHIIQTALIARTPNSLGVNNQLFNFISKTNN